MGQPGGRDLRQRRLRALPADGRRRDRLRRAPAARSGTAGGRPLPRASGCRRSSSGPAMPARGSWPTGAPSSAPTRASPCAPTAPAASTSTRASRASARAARPPSRRCSADVLGHRLRRDQRARRRHRRLAAQHGRVRVPDDDRRRRRAAEAGRPSCATRRFASPPPCSRSRTRQLVVSWRRRGPPSRRPGALGAARRASSTRAILGQGLPDGESPGLDATAYFEPPEAAYSFGTAAAAVAVDAETGRVRRRAGRDGARLRDAVNPTLVEGQVRGGLAQGFGQAPSGGAALRRRHRPLVNGTMIDYFAPPRRPAADRAAAHRGALAGDAVRASAAWARSAASRPLPRSPTRSVMPSPTSASSSTGCRSPPNWSGGRWKQPGADGAPRRG